MTIWNRLIPLTPSVDENHEGEALVTSYNWCMTNHNEPEKTFIRTLYLQSSGTGHL